MTVITPVPSRRDVQLRRRKATQRLTIVLALLSIALLIIAVFVLKQAESPAAEATPEMGNRRRRRRDSASTRAQ